MNIRKFYLENYPTDELGVEINEFASFLGLYHILINGGDAYEYIGVYDSIVRERLFEHLAQLLKTPYDYVYKLWLNKN